MKFSINKDFFIKCDQIRRSLRILSHLLKKSLLMENFVFYAVNVFNTFCDNIPLVSMLSSTL